MPRQKVNHHLRALEQHDLTELVEERRKARHRTVMQAAAYWCLHSGPRRGNVIVAGLHLFSPAPDAEPAWPQWLSELKFD